MQGMHAMHAADSKFIHIPQAFGLRGPSRIIAAWKVAHETFHRYNRERGSDKDATLAANPQHGCEFSGQATTGYPTNQISGSSATCFAGGSVYEVNLEAICSYHAVVPHLTGIISG